MQIMQKGKDMELNEMEKRMLYQTEGSERYALMHELLMASRYAKDPDRLLSVKLDAPAPCRLVAPDLDFVCRAFADCLPQHLQVI